jgi:glycosyltransferase involved in cell wall biosynthesis
MIITTCPQAWQDTGAYWALKHLEVTEKTKHILWEQLQDQDGDLVISCGIGEVDLLRLRKKGRKIGVLFCSPLAQAHVVPSSLNGDLDALLRYKNMLGSGDIDYIFLLSERLTYLFKNERIIYLPPALQWENFPKLYNIESRKGICFFGTMDKHKNLATMFGAVKHSKIEDPFIITGQEKTQMCSFFSNLLDMKNIVLYPRLQRFQLLDIMNAVKLGIQIGFSESFSYVTWELAMTNVPSIISPSIYWYITDPILKKFCYAENLDDPILVGEKIKKVYFDSVLYKDLCILSQNVAVSIMKKNNQMDLEILERL